MKIKKNTIGFYKHVLKTTGIKEERGLMVHFVPQFHQIVKFEKLASRLTRETWRALKKGSGSVEMEDGSVLSLNTPEHGTRRYRLHAAFTTKKRKGDHGLYVF